MPDLGAGLVIAVVAVAVALERLDFSERLLASGHQAKQLPGRAHR